MGKILVTGASGLVGKALSSSLAKKHEVVCMSRRYPGNGVEFVKGDFSDFEDLRGLDKYEISAVVHLGAVTGGCSERDAIMVNVEGTRRLMRYLIDRDCKKFAFASSIAVVGMQSVKFRPLQIPISDTHPCLDKDGYGVSKFLMEEVTKYYSRQNPDIDVINLRLASVPPPDSMPKPRNEAGEIPEWTLGHITAMHLDDAVRAFSLAVESELKPGVRIMNATPKLASVAIPTAEILRVWYGPEFDLSYFEKPGNEFASVYDSRLIKRELGFEA